MHLLSLLRRLATNTAIAGIVFASPAIAKPAPGAAKPQFVTLGTGGGPVMRLKRSQPANAIVIGDAVYLFDVGDGTERQMLADKLRLPQVKAIFMSHLHIDHIGGLSSLLVDRWVLGNFSPLTLIGPEGTRVLARSISAGFSGTEFATASIGQQRPTIASSIAAQDLARTMERPMLVYQDDRVRVYAVANSHFHYPAGSAAATHARSYSYRIEAGDRSFVFTGDTGVSSSVETLAKGADLLISEVMDPVAIRVSLSHQPGLSAPAADTMVANMSRDHLLPEQVGQLATRAGVKAVVLTHLVPGRDDETSTDNYASGVRANFAGPVTVANDLQHF